MNPAIIVILTLAILSSFSCEKGVTAAEMKQEAAEMLLGKWIVDRQVDEVYSPLTTLSSTTEYSGSAGDFYIFKTNQIAEVNSITTGNSQQGYEVVNPYQLIIGQTLWRIEKLTTDEMHLVLDRNDAVQYKRFVTKLYLKR